MIRSLGGFLLIGLSIGSVAAARYERYILTPSSRTLAPHSVYNVNGSVVNAEALTVRGGGISSFGPSSAVTYDFGKNVAGIVSFSVTNVNQTGEYIGISFTESSLWINSGACDATADVGLDEPLWFQVSNGSSYTADKAHQRGGFRYLNVYHNTTGDVDLQNLTVYFTAVPNVSEAGMRDYTGYFHSNDEAINRVWYAGAYTNQLCSIDPTAGDSLVYPGTNSSNSTVTPPHVWYNNQTISNGSTVLVDGGKRDRLVWPGDIAISGPSIFVSTLDMITIKNALDSLLDLQNSSGALPYCGRPFWEQLDDLWSFTYHLYTLLDIYDYYLFTGELDYLEANWNKFKLGLDYPLQFIDSTGLANVTSSADWLRFGMGGHNIEANSILYYTLGRGILLAQILGDSSNSSNVWSATASNIKSAANELLWDSASNLYRDNDTEAGHALHPQDGNCWAVIANVTDSPAKARNISDALAARWTPYGPPAPEAGATVSPFISGFELQAHYIAGQSARAVQLVKSMWADFMLDDPRMTNSTFIEGYSTNGDLHYAPYHEDARISHAHGWATGPTSTLTFFGAGLTITGAAGKTWSVQPNLGGLTHIEAGFKTSLGEFAVKVTSSAPNATDMRIELSVPGGTTGSVSVAHPGCAATLTASPQPGKTTGLGRRDRSMKIQSGAHQTERVSMKGLEGGNWIISMTSDLL